MTRSNNPENGDVSEPLERRLDIVMAQASPKAERAFLLGIGGEVEGKLFPLRKRELLIGRAAHADVRLEEKAVSHAHAELCANGGGWSVRDLESTNGTFLNGELIAGSVRLQGGDTVAVGSTAFTYLAGTEAEGLEPPEGESTAELNGATLNYAEALQQQSFAPHRGAVVPRQASYFPTQVPLEDDGVSMTDVVRKVRAYWVYVRRYGWLVATCTCFGVGAGVVQARLKPPPGAAWFEMTLSPQGGGGQGEGEGPATFQSPESTFRSLPLIRKTVSKMGAPSISLEAATSIQDNLGLERADYNSPLWRGGFQDSTAEEAAKFLTEHLNMYLDSEIEKVLGGIRAEATFWREKRETVRQELSRAEAELLEFQGQHPEVLPQPPGTDNPLVEAKRRAASVESRLRNVTGQIARAEQKLSQGTSLRSLQLQKAERYRERARTALDRVIQLKAQGLGELHPDVKRARKEQQTHEAKAQELERSAPSSTEMQVDSNTLALKEQLATLRAEQSRLRGSAAAARTKVASAESLSLPALRQRFAELQRAAATAQANFAEASKTLEGKQLQLDKERAGVRGHYDIITPPTPEPGSVMKASVKRAGLGGFVGLFLALLAAVALEFRTRWLDTHPA